MLSEQKQKDLQEEIKNRIQSEIGDIVKKIIVFGSYAKKEATKESDIDILLLTDANNNKIEDKVTDISVDLSLKYDIVVNILLKKNEQFNKYKDILPFYQNIERHGISIYG